MTEMPDDIKTIAGSASCEFFARSHDGEPEADVIIDIVSSLLIAERLRNAEIMEEVRKVLKPFAEMTIQGKPPSDPEIAATYPLFAGRLRAARALLSKLEKL